MEPTPKQIIDENRSLEVIMNELANVCKIYRFEDLDIDDRKQLINIYAQHRKHCVIDILESIDLCGSTTYQDLENVAKDFDADAAYFLDKMLERNWDDEFDPIYEELAEIDLDNNWRNGNLFGKAH